MTLLEHAIGLYFVINAYIAGRNNSKGFMIVTMFIFGLLLVILEICGWAINSLFWLSNRKYYWLSRLKLRLGYYKKGSGVSLTRAVNVYRTGNKYARRFIEELDRKYGYGIVEKSKQENE